MDILVGRALGMSSTKLKALGFLQSFASSPHNPLLALNSLHDFFLNIEQDDKKFGTGLVINCPSGLCQTEF